MNYNLTMLNVHIKSCFCSTSNLLNTAFISALKITQTKKRSSKLGVFLFVRFIRDRDRIRTYDRLLRRQMLYPAELRDLIKNPCKSFTYKGLSGETGIRTQATLSR